MSRTSHEARDPSRHDARVEANRQHRDVLCAGLAARQHGVITRSQAAECGHTRHTIERLIRIGLWRRLLPGVFGIGEPTSEWHQHLAAATKWSGGIASHSAAATLLNLDGVDERALEVTTDRRLKSPEPSVLIHRCRQLPPDSTAVDGIPTTSATRTLFDLAGDLAPAELELAMEDALRRGLTSLPRLRWCLTTMGGQGRRGTASMRTVLSAYEAQATPTDSAFEARLHQLLRSADLPLPRRQFEINDGDRLIGRADFAYPLERVVIEAVSFRWHSGRAAWSRDQGRWNAFIVAGWRVLNVTWEDLTTRPQEVVDQVRRAVGREPLFR